MAMQRCLHCGNTRAHQPDRQQVPKIYTPTVDGFEHFLREAVGLDAGVTDVSSGVDGRLPEERPKS